MALFDSVDTICSEQWAQNCDNKSLITEMMKPVANKKWRKKENLKENLTNLTKEMQIKQY